MYAQLLDDNPDALWSRQLIDNSRVKYKDVPELVRVVVAIDPQATKKDNVNSNETGIIVAGLGANKHVYILSDVSISALPNKWGRIAIDSYILWKADRIVAEVNQGGDMVQSVIKSIDPLISYKSVRATKGKYTRAEPVASLYEQNMVHHVGSFSHLEDQMCEWMPGQPSPDRLDAMVWAVTELKLKSKV